MTMAEKNKKVAAGLAVGAFALAGVGAFAFFSDSEHADFQGANGVSVGSDNPVDVVPNDDGKTPTDPRNDPTHPKDDTSDGDEKDGISDEGITERWARLNVVARANYNPGDAIALPLQLYNGGNFKIDVRESYVITSSEPLTQSDVANMEFRLRSAVAMVNDAPTATYGTLSKAHPYAYDAADGNDLGTDVAANPTLGFDAVDVELLSPTQVKYSVPAYSIDTNQEVIRDYYLIFDKDADNDFQGATVTVEALIEAKQTNDVNGNVGDPNAGWVTVANETINFGGADTKVVPVKE